MVSIAYAASAAGLVVALLVALTDAATFLACPLAPAVPQDRRKDTTRLKYTTYNVNFLMLRGFGTSPKCPGPSCPWATVAEAEKHIAQVAQVIKLLDSDMLQLNEVEDCYVLQQLIKQIEELGDATYKPYLVRGTDTATGQNAALLTRIDPIVDLKRTEASATIRVSDSTCRPTSTTYAKRAKRVSKHFYTTFNVSGVAKLITVIGTHLLANPQSNRRCFDREAQATVLAGLVDAAVLNGEHVILSGDINDFSRTLPDRNNNSPISSVLRILVGSNMVETAAFTTQEDRYSQWWDENADCVYSTTEASSLDHILVSKSLASSVMNVSFGHNLYTAACNSYNSDHYPITVTIQTNGTTPTTSTVSPMPTTPAHDVAAWLSIRELLLNICIIRKQP